MNFMMPDHFLNGIHFLFFIFYFLFLLSV